MKKTIIVIALFIFNVEEQFYKLSNYLYKTFYLQTISIL